MIHIGKKKLKTSKQIFKPKTHPSFIFWCLQISEVSILFELCFSHVHHCLEQFCPVWVPSQAVCGAQKVSRTHSCWRWVLGAQLNGRVVASFHDLYTSQYSMDNPFASLCAGRYGLHQALFLGEGQPYLHLRSLKVTWSDLAGSPFSTPAMQRDLELPNPQSIPQSVRPYGL